MATTPAPVVLPNTPTPDLARIVCENCWTHFRSWAAWPGITVHHEPDVTWSEAPIPHVFFNQVYGARFRYSAAERRIATLKGHAERRGMPLIWRVGPDSTPGNLPRLLERGGLTYADDGLAMAMDLAQLDLRDPTSSHVVIRDVRDDAALRLWTEIGIEGFEFPASMAGPVFDMHRAMGLGPDRNHQHFLAGIDGETVGMATMTTHCGVVALQNLATRRAYRRRGVGTALARHVMREGRKRGFRTGVLQASSLGQGLYRAIGFREVGRVFEFVLDAPASGRAGSG